MMALLPTLLAQAAVPAAEPAAMSAQAAIAWAIALLLLSVALAIVEFLVVTWGMLLIGATIAFFLARKKDSAALIVSLFVILIISSFFLYAFPVNSPNNYILARGKVIEGFDPNPQVLAYQAELRDEQKQTLPISTFPSTHITFGITIVYFWAKYRKWTLLFLVPAFLLMALGTVYLAQHYAVDVLLAIPVAAISIAIGELTANKFVREVAK
jgi:membrane-associated phospholipid phosphatase